MSLPPNVDSPNQGAKTNPVIKNNGNVGGTLLLSEGVLPEGFRPIGPIHSLRKAQEWLLVLRSVGLEGFVREGGTAGWWVLVTEHQYEQAFKNLRLYEIENRDFPQIQTKDRPLYPSSVWAPVLCCALALFFCITGPARSQSRWFHAGTADTDQLLHGAPWQAITALTLHADSNHVLGNALAGGLFLSAVHRRLGPGLGSFVVLSAGATGNALNALWHTTQHRSIGASTAVFAAVGVLTATQLVLNRAQPSISKLTRWGPVAGGLALLGMLGADPHSDLHAHGFGLLAGIVLGLMAATPLRSRIDMPPRWVQWLFGTLSVVLVVGAWSLAMRISLPLRTQPHTPSRRASRCVDARNPTP